MKRVIQQFSNFQFRFSSQSIRQYDFQDVLIMKRVPSGKKAAEDQFYQLHYKSQKIIFPAQLTLFQFENELQKRLPDVLSVSTHKQGPKDEIRFAGSTPMFMVLKDDFILRLNEHESFIILTRVDDPPVIDSIKFYPITEHAIQEQLNEIDQPERVRIVLNSFIHKIFDELSKNESKALDKNYIFLTVKKVIMKMGLNAKYQKALIDEQISFLQQKELRLQQIKKDVISDLERKEQRQLHQIYLYILLQIAFTQYGTYWVWGWGVMEPITFLLGVSDMIIAYIFWMRTTKSYWYENILKVAVEKRLNEKLDQSFYYKDELNDVQRMIEYLKFKQMIYSTNVDEVLNVIQGAIDGKQEKIQENNEDDE